MVKKLNRLEAEEKIKRNRGKTILHFLIAAFRLASDGWECEKNNKKSVNKDINSVDSRKEQLI